MIDIKQQILEAKEIFNNLVSQAREQNIKVNLWISGVGPASIKPSELDLDFVDES